MPSGDGSFLVKDVGVHALSGGAFGDGCWAGVGSSSSKAVIEKHTLKLAYWSTPQQMVQQGAAEAVVKAEFGEREVPLEEDRMKDGKAKAP